jgi:hypothetical protein
MLPTTRRAATVLAAAAVLPVGVLIGVTSAAAAPAHSGAAGQRPPTVYTVHEILNGSKLRHRYVPAGSTTPKSEPLMLPDDITILGDDLFSGFQNGVGPQGQASSDGNLDSTIVEYTMTGREVAQWDVKGKCDGLTADPFLHLVIATVNEDANSSIYTITPGAPASAQIQHYQYNEPLPHNGGTDAISVYDGQVLVSASAPGTTGEPAPQPAYPAVYSVAFDPASHVATVKPVFYDEATATVANVGSGQGSSVKLGLTDPDSNEVVPLLAPRFRGDFMLTSQGDQEQIFTSPAGGLGQHLSVLRLSRSVDDTAWVTFPSGALFASNTSGDTVDMVTGWFRPGTVLVATTPCDQNDAPATCPGPGFPPNYVGVLNPWTGQISRLPVIGATLEPQGMIFLPGIGA